MEASAGMTRLRLMSLMVDGGWTGWSQARDCPDEIELVESFLPGPPATIGPFQMTHATSELSCFKVQ